jgi:hypothetical protein
MDLVEFVTARLDEDEREIRADPPVGMGYARLPVRMLREIQAKRVVLAEYAAVAGNEGHDDVEYAHGWAAGLGLAVRAMATAWSDHPDWRTDWATPAAVR